MSEILPGGTENELKNKVFPHYKETFDAPSNTSHLTLSDFLADIHENDIKKTKWLPKVHAGK